MCPASRTNAPSILLAHSQILRKWFIIIIFIIYLFVFVNAVTGLISKEMTKHKQMYLQGIMLNFQYPPPLHQMNQR